MIEGYQWKIGILFFCPIMGKAKKHINPKDTVTYMVLQLIW